MAVDTVLLLVVLLLGSLGHGVYSWRRWLRHPAPTDPLKELPTERRQAILRSIEEGRTVDDPADAGLALELIAQADLIRRVWRIRWTDDLVSVAFALVTVWVMWQLGVPRGFLVTLGLLLGVLTTVGLILSGLSLMPFARRAEARRQGAMTRAATANELLIGRR